MRAFTVGQAPFREISANERGTGPAHAWIEGWIETQVRDEVLVPGDRLPPESELAALFSVSRMTLRQALGALEEKLVIVRRRGRHGGTFIRDSRVEHHLTGLRGFSGQMHRCVIRPGGIVVSADLVPPRAVPKGPREALRLRAGEGAHRVVKIRLANTEPVALEDTWLPAGLFPDLLDHDLTGSLYELIATTYDAAPALAFEELEPATADPVTAGHLGIEPGALLMRIIRTTETADGRRVEFAHDLFRSDRARITMTSRAADSALAWDEDRHPPTPGRDVG